MKVTAPAHYALFHCLAGACPDTCCVGWEVVVDEESARRYLAAAEAWPEHAPLFRALAAQEQAHTQRLLRLAQRVL